jgi:hypothetical protein
MRKKSRLIASLVLLWMLSEVGYAEILCGDGTGTFTAELPTGVQVTVGPEMNDGFAARAGRATLGSG